ncbi:FimV/HubP family polar landmark protein [Pseudomonas boanensis]|uniref:FimV/HubP family polar landmark protein n=1 Tax=Metapseudomonas boanensis TaxID=2822138 RepID=UPI0035D50EDC
MVRVRKLVLAIAAASALTSGMAHALGLGEVTLRSSLNQPLVAEIELLEVRDLASAEVKPGLAPAEEFSKAGVDRQYFLSDLKFTSVIKPNGRSVIRVTSTKPVREPYLNFLVEVLWPNGRLLREYTLLLDPPLYSPQTAVAAAPQIPVAAAAPVPRPVVEAAPVRTAPVAPAALRPAAPAPAAPPARKAETDQYRTTSRDTLWDIAQRTRSGGSVHQAMLAIQDLNPDAFIGGNINRLKSGQVLRLPDDQQIASRSQAEAIAQVAAQNTAWRESRSLAGEGKRQVDATKRASAGDAPSEVENKDSLRLVSAESGKASSGSDKGGDGESKALNDKLAVTQESLDSSRRENDELKSRVSDLQSQMDKLQRLIQLKDDQLAKLQADMSAVGSQTPAPTSAAAPVAAEAKPQVVKDPVEPPVVAPAAAPEAASQQPADLEAQAQTPIASEPSQSAAPAAPVVSEPPVQAAPAVAPAPASAPMEEQGGNLIDDLLANPMLLGIAGGSALVALLVLLMILSRRNALKESELQSSLAAQDDESIFDTDLDLKDDSFAGFAGAELESAVVESPPASTAKTEDKITAQTSDVISEADIYIAYGRFSQAAELLQGAINEEPQRADLRLKLMEVYAELGDREGFARQERDLNEIGRSAAEIDQLKAKYPAIVMAAAGAVGLAAIDDIDSFGLDDLKLDEAAPAATVAPGEDLDDAFDLSLDDLDLDLETELAGDKPVRTEPAEPSLELSDTVELDAPAKPVSDLDFDLSFGGDDKALPQGEGAIDLSDELAGFSLDLEPSAQSLVDEDDFLLSLDEDLDVPAVAVEGVAPPVAGLPDVGAQDLPADFDLSQSNELGIEPLADNDSFAAQLDEVSADLDQLSERLQQQDVLTAREPAAPALAEMAPEEDDDFDFLSGTDETATKLDLARAYIDMGDTEGARDILDEVLSEGSDTQQEEARELIARLS